MSRIDRMYKTFSLEELSKLNISLKREYYYLTENDTKSIKEQGFENTSSKNVYQLIDDDYEWNPKKDCLFLNIKISLDNCDCIFGKNGTCFADSIVGIGLSWKPDKSRIKRCIKIGEITVEDHEKIIELNDIKLENISSNVDFKLFFYIAKPGKIDGNNFFGNEQGMVIYEDVAWSIIIDGGASIFPIMEIEDESKPLWYYWYNSQADICEDFFDDQNLFIVLNKKHKLYPYISLKSNEYNEEFLNEILSSGITCIINAIKTAQPENKIDFSVDCERGSIMQALKYFNERLGFKINGDYDDLIISIKNYFDKEY